MGQDRHRTWYNNYVEDYRAYARMRGFGSNFNNWPYHRRGFIECWAEPGFHRFWQIWNPGISYFAYILFVRLGGRTKWAGPTMAAFLICGIVHTIVVLPFFGRWSISVITAFACFGALTIISRFAASILQQERWPIAVNAALNVALVAGSFDIGFRADRLFGF